MRAPAFLWIDNTCVGSIGSFRLSSSWAAAVVAGGMSGLTLRFGLVLRACFRGVVRGGVVFNAGCGDCVLGWDRDTLSLSLSKKYVLEIN